MKMNIEKGDNMSTYKIFHKNGDTSVDADLVEERQSHFVLLKKTGEHDRSFATVKEMEPVAFCPKDFLIVKTG